MSISAVSPIAGGDLRAIARTVPLSTTKRLSAAERSAALEAGAEAARVRGPDAIRGAAAAEAGPAADAGRADDKVPARDPRTAAWLFAAGGRQSARRSAREAEIGRVLGSLRSRDAAVRAHEAAHVAAGGRYVTGAASYAYQRGPDGREYAVGGEVSIDTSIPGDPEEAVRKMRTVRAAALAPADPSAADLAVAAAAASAEALALAEIAASRAESAAGIATADK